MGDSDASAPSTSSPRPKRPAETSDHQEPATKKATVKKKNYTSIHEEYTRYKYIEEGEERTGSQCNECGFKMADINPTNLKLHVKRRHPEILDKVVGGSFLFDNLFNMFCIFSFSSARDEAHRKSIEKSIVELGTPVADSILVPPKEPKGKGKAKVCLTRIKRIMTKYVIHCVQIWNAEKQRHGNQLLAVAVAGSCLPMNFVRDPNIKRWVNYIAPEVPCFGIIGTLHDFICSTSCPVTRSSVLTPARSLECCGLKSEII